MTEPPRPGEGAGPSPDPVSPPPPSTPYSVPGEAASPDTTPPPAPPYETPAAPSFETPQYQPPQADPPPVPGAAPGSPGPGYPPPGPGYPPPGTGYGQPPGGGYPPAGGYPPPGGYGFPGAAPAGYANNDEKTWALVAHFGGAIGAFITGGVAGWIGPLIALLAKGPQSPTVRAHAVAALNFQILWTIITVVGYITMCILIGFLIVPIAWLVATIVGVIAGVKANEGQLYRYPLSISMIK